MSYHGKTNYLFIAPFDCIRSLTSLLFSSLLLSSPLLSSLFLSSHLTPSNPSSALPPLLSYFYHHVCTLYRARGTLEIVHSRTLSLKSSLTTASALQHIVFVIACLLQCRSGTPEQNDTYSELVMEWLYPMMNEFIVKQKQILCTRRWKIFALLGSLVPWNPILETSEESYNKRGAGIDANLQLTETEATGYSGVSSKTPLVANIARANIAKRRREHESRNPLEMAVKRRSSIVDRCTDNGSGSGSESGSGNAQRISHPIPHIPHVTHVPPIPASSIHSSDTIRAIKSYNTYLYYSPKLLHLLQLVIAAQPV